MVDIFQGRAGYLKHNFVHPMKKRRKCKYIGPDCTVDFRREWGHSPVDKYFISYVVDKFLTNVTRKKKGPK